MKIGILTQPLHSNYGGLLQAWALQKTLVDMGHEAIIINRVWFSKPRPFWKRCLAMVKNEVYIALGKRKRYIGVTKELKDFSEQYVRKFRQNRYKGISPEIRTNEELIEYVKSQKFDVYIVGSDQVWRPRYSPNLMTYFLDFAKDNNSVKKIAYAASFGVDNWEFSDEQTSKAAELAPLFDLITVRESSGVNLVEKYLNSKAMHVLDPTMLLDKEDYFKLIENPTFQLKDSAGDLFCYVLDQSESVLSSIKICTTAMGYQPFICNYKTPVYQLKNVNQKEESIVPPVEQWLKSFANAKMVVTDSFHGVVFSIIFNKPFWVVVNKNRGAARFDSILKQFNLEDRVVKDLQSINWKKSIDWNMVNNRRSTQANLSKSILALNIQ